MPQVLSCPKSFAEVLLGGILFGNMIVDPVKNRRDIGKEADGERQASRRRFRSSRGYCIKRT
jgi:hypothetical protein